MVQYLIRNTSNDRTNQKDKIEKEISRDVEEKRQQTDVAFIFVLVVIFCSWLGVGVSVLCLKPTFVTTIWKDNENATIRRYSVSLSKQTNQHFRQDDYDMFFANYTKIMSMCSHILRSYFTSIPIFMILVGVSMFLYICFLEKIAMKNFVYLSLVLDCFIILYLAMSIVSNFYDFTQDYDSAFAYGSIVIKFLIIFYLIAIIHCAYKEGVNNITDVIKKSYRFIIHQPSLLTFSFAINILAILILAISIVVFNSLLLFDDSAAYVIIYFYINMLGGAFLLNFLINFGFIIISEATAQSYQFDDYPKINEALILQTITKIARNHIGTVSLASTNFLPWIWATIYALKDNSTKKTESLFSRMMGKIFLISYMKNFALVQTSIHGHDFKASSRAVFKQSPGNSALYLAGVEMSNFIRRIGGMIILTVLYTLVYFTIYYHYDFSDEEVHYTTIVIASTIMSVLLSYYVFIDATVCTVLTYKAYARYVLQIENCRA